MKKNDFGVNFKWGTASAAYQIEGAWNEGGKGLSVWDTFVRKKGKIKGGHTGDVSCDFYHRYESDLDLLQFMSVPNFRFSLSWPRIFPSGTGKINPEGVAFYHKLIDACLKRGIEPWITLYHWDLPQALQNIGGWENRDIIRYFADFTDLCTRTYGDRVKYWMIFNEPTSFLTLGYLLGIHAPGVWGIHTFYRATHHANLALAEAGRIAKNNCPKAEIGTTFFTCEVQPLRPILKDRRAAERLDIIMNTLYLEPLLGLGYPFDEFPALRKMEKYFHPEDGKNIQHQFDFIGLQNYTREVVKSALFPPKIWAKRLSAKERYVPMEDITLMGWEVYPEGIYHLLMRFGKYPGVKKIYVTENGASFPDILIDNRVEDPLRKNYIQKYLQNVLRAKLEGVPVEGYFVWSFTDNFEWAEGYNARFGLVYVDFHTQNRIIKQSGLWYKAFLEGSDI